MTNAQSKFDPVYVSCKQYVHPWTDSCWNSTAGLLIQACFHSYKIYTTVYLLSLVMRGRIPSKRDIKRTILAIIQSSGFLTTNAFTFVLYACILRNLLGKFYYLTAAFVPSFLASLTAIFIERPSRRPLLALYVANVATETIWRMAESRGYVKSISNGQAVIFGVCGSILLYFYRLGYHRLYKDSLFDILRFVVGRNEEVVVAQREEETDEMLEEEPVIQAELEIHQEAQLRPLSPPPPQQQQHRPIDNRLSSGQNNYIQISTAIRMYSKLLKILKVQKRHHSCPHNNSCMYYSLRGGLKMFMAGFGLQITLKLILEMRKLIQFKVKIRKTFFNRDTLKLGVFLGGFSFLYKSISCTLRHITDFDHPAHAIPAGLIASIAFTQYPDTTVALYIMWKTLQIAYNIGIKKGIVPEVPGFIIFLYCLSTATLFHAGLLEPLNLRPSYWKFLHSLSGGRVSLMDRKSFDVWGLDSNKQMEEVVRKTHTAVKYVKFGFS